MLRQKYQHEYVDDILTNQKKEFESKTRDFSPSMSETSKEVLIKYFLLKKIGALILVMFTNCLINIFKY